MKQPIRIYDTQNGSNLVLMAHIENYSNLVFTRKRSEVGTFNFSIDDSIAGSEEILVDRLIHLPPNDSKVGRITKVIKSQSGNKTTLSVSGEEAKGLVGWRVVTPDAGQENYTVTGPAETVIKTAISKFLGPSASASLKIPNIAIYADAGAGDTFTLTGRYSNLLKEIQTCSESTGVWWYLAIDLVNSQLSVRVTPGKDRTTSQTTNDWAPFSTRFKTIESATRTDTKEAYKNVAIVAGQGEGINRAIRTVGSLAGWDRRETFVDARQLSTNPALDSRGAEALVKSGESVAIDTTILPESQLVLDRDYALGDTVTMEAFGLSEDRVITSVTEGWTSSGYTIDLGFGKPVKTLADTVIEFSGEVQTVKANPSPTKQLLESGSNYFKFDDGTLIQWGIASGSFSGTATFNHTVTLPVAFINTGYSFNPQVDSTTYSGTPLYIVTQSTTSAKTTSSYTFTLVYYDGAGHTTNYSVNWQAIGRWK